MPLTTGKAGLLRQQAKESESTVLHGGVEKHQEQADKQGCEANQVAGESKQEHK
jgi:hypothetical protein